jgi:hypothetical protein
MTITEYNAPLPERPSVEVRPCRPRLTSPDNLVGRLNLEWARLSVAAESMASVAGWGAVRPALSGAGSLEGVLSRVSQADVKARDEVLLALLELSHEGDQLAGRTVLQAMLGKAVRVAACAATRPDVRGDQEEALACAVSSLWLVIATYPIARRRSRVAANLALDTVALVQRGHTGSSHFRRTYPETPFADLRTVGESVHQDLQPADPHGPADAELFRLLAWAVRHDVLTLAEARLLIRVYTVDEQGRPGDARAVAQQEGLTWLALRQRCHRLARRVGNAAIAAGISTSDVGELDGDLAVA